MPAPWAGAASARQAASAEWFTASAEWFTRLEKLMQWRSQGLLTETEFVAAKRQLGLHEQ